MPPADPSNCQQLLCSADRLRLRVQAFYLARTGRPGPVLIDVPKDVQQQLAVPDWDVPMAISGYMTRLPQLPTPAVRAPKSPQPCSPWLLALSWPFGWLCHFLRACTATWPVNWPAHVPSSCISKHFLIWESLGGYAD